MTQIKIDVSIHAPVDQVEIRTEPESRSPRGSVD